MSAKKPALGRGLEALFRPPPAPVAPPSASATAVRAAPAAAPAEVAPDGPTLRRIPIAMISPNPHQPRKDFDPEKLAELALSIKQTGVLQPVLVRRVGGEYQLVVGERRWRAAQQAGLLEIPAMVHELDERESSVAAIVENVQRDDLNAIEEAEAYQKLQQEFGLTQEMVAQTVGKSRVAVTNAIRLLRLAPFILDWVRQDKLSAGHARALLSLEDPDSQKRLAQEILAKGLTVREAEREARRMAVKAKTAGPANRRFNPDEVDFRGMEEKLAAHLGLRVKIEPKSNAAGRIEVFYTSLDEFQRFCDNLGLVLDVESS